MLPTINLGFLDVLESFSSVSAARFFIAVNSPNTARLTSGMYCKRQEGRQNCDTLRYTSTLFGHGKRQYIAVCSMAFSGGGGDGLYT